MRQSLLRKNYYATKYARITALIIILAVQVWHACADHTINIQGHFVETYYRYNKPTGKYLRVAFSVSLSANTCGILATNLDDDSIWETIIFDGTNTYVLTPFDGHFLDVQPGAKWCGLVNPGRQYYMMGLSLVNTFVPWITYCLRPSDVTSDMPSPGVDWRVNANTYGWRWTNIEISSDGNFFQKYSIVRDSSLDLNDKSELLRTNLQYPENIDDFQNQKMYLDFLKDIPDGWVSGTYRCDQWYKTNGFTIPMHGEFKHYTYSAGTTFITSSRVIQADAITFSKENAALVPLLLEKTYVRDYRYTQRSERRMFPYAEYTALGSWKSANDPDLIAQANRYMKYGPELGQLGVVSKVFSPEGGHLIVIWSLLLFINAAVIIILVSKKLKK